MKYKKCLFDTSALIALLKKEQGHEMLSEVLTHSSISAVNFSELVAVLIRNNIEEKEIDEILQDIVPEILPFDEKIAIKAGKIINITKEYGLSLGDRACIATSIHYNIPVYTTDKVWEKIAKQLHLNVVVVR